MITFYLIPVTDGNTSKCLNSIKQTQGRETKCVYLANHDISQVFRVPFIQKYEGIALVLTTKAILKEAVNPEVLLNGADYVHDKDLNFFILNCNSEYFKKNFSSSKLVTTDLRNYVSSFNNPSEELNNYFHLIEKDKKSFTCIGDTDKPVKLVFDGSSWKLTGE